MAKWMWLYVIIWFVIGLFLAGHEGKDNDGNPLPPV